MKYKCFLIIIIAIGICYCCSEKKDIKITTIKKDPIRYIGVDDSTSTSPEYFYKVERVRYNKYDDKVYVVDTGNYRIAILDDKLNFITTFGRKGQGPGEFERANDIAFTKDYIIVTDDLNGRITYFNYNFKEISTIRPKSFNYYNIFANSEGRLYTNNPSSGFLFTIININGETIDEFGEIYPYPAENFIHSENRVTFAIDNEDNLYCAFVNQPIIRKYNSNNRLVYEENFKNLSFAKYKIKIWNERMKEVKKKGMVDRTYVYKGIAEFLSVDDKYVYLTTQCIEDDRFEFPMVYIIRKENGLFTGDRIRFNFKKQDVDFGYFKSIDFSSEFIYAYDLFDMFIAQYKK